MLLFRIFCLLLSLCATAAHTTPAWLNQYADFVRADARTYQIPGYAFVFIEQGKQPQFFTYGKTQSKGDSIGTDTVFRLASVSKTFTGALMAKLVAENALSYDTPISELAPNYGFAQAGNGNIQLRHLLNQSSGYMPNAYDNLIEANYSLKRVLNKLAELERLCQPGKCYTYQNALFGVVETYFDEQNSSYQRALDKHFFSPLGMRAASVGKQGLTDAKQWAKPHVAIARDKYRQGKVDSTYYRFSSAAGVNASIADMQIWLQAMLGEHPQVLSKALIKQLTTPLTKTKRELGRRNWRQYLDDAHYGLGWRIYQFDGQKLAYHGGWVKGYRADIAFAPAHGVGFAMLMNAESNRINAYSAEFWAQFFDQMEHQNSLVSAQ